MKTEEQWKQIEDSQYEVSSFGRVRRRGRRKCLKSKAYPRVFIAMPGQKLRRRLVHVLVAEAFLDEQPTPEHGINHIDGDQHNPASSNLEWLTPRENQLHAIETGLYEGRGEGHGNAKLSDAQVLEIRSRYTGAYGEQSRLGREYGVSQSLIAKIVHGEIWTHLKVTPVPTQGLQDRTGAKLNAAQVREIRKSYVGGYGQQTALAKKYGVTAQVIYGVVTGKTWKHLGLGGTKKGQHHGRAKLNNRQVKQARKRYDAGTATVKVLATQYGVDRQIMLNIVTRKTWQHVP